MTSIKNDHIVVVYVTPRQFNTINLNVMASLRCGKLDDSIPHESIAHEICSYLLINNFLNVSASCKRDLVFSSRIVTNEIDNVCTNMSYRGASIIYLTPTPLLQIIYSYSSELPIGFFINDIHTVPNCIVVCNQANDTTIVFSRFIVVGESAKYCASILTDIRYENIRFDRISGDVTKATIESLINRKIDNLPIKGPIFIQYRDVIDDSSMNRLIIQVVNEEYKSDDTFRKDLDLLMGKIKEKITHIGHITNKVDTGLNKSPTIKPVDELTILQRQVDTLNVAFKDMNNRLKLIERLDFNDNEVIDTGKKTNKLLKYLQIILTNMYLMRKAHKLSVQVYINAFDTTNEDLNEISQRVESIRHIQGHLYEFTLKQRD